MLQGEQVCLTSHPVLGVGLAGLPSLPSLARRFEYCLVTWKQMAKLFRLFASAQRTENMFPRGAKPWRPLSATTFLRILVASRLGLLVHAVLEVAQDLVLS